MERCKILASKRLTKSFQKVKDMEVWESIVFDSKEAQEVVAAALRKMTAHSDPLTITITPMDN